MENIILTNNKDLRLVSVKVGVLSTLRFELPLVSASATHVEVIVTSGDVHSAYTATFIDATKRWQCDIAASQFPTVGKQSYEVAYVLDGKQFWDGKGWIEIEDATTSGIEPQPRPEPYRYAVVSVNGYGADAQGAVRIPKTFIATDSPVTTEGYMEGDIYFNRETGATWTLCNVQGTLTWVFNYKNYYTKAETDEAIDRVAAYYITYDAAGNPFPTYAALANAQTVYSGGKVRVPTRNDYCVVLADETHDGAEYRYIYAVAEGQTTGSWQPQFPVEGVMTVDQTVQKNSQNPVSGGGVWSAIWGALSALPTGFSSLYDWCVSQLAGKASKADATLTEKWTPTFALTDAQKELFSQTPGASDNHYALTIVPSSSTDSYLLYVGSYQAAAFIKDPSNSTKLIFKGGDARLGLQEDDLVATLSGYQLGSQSDKPVASEAEAEALRQGKLDKSGGTMTGTLTIAEVDGGGTEIIKAFLGSTSSQKFVIGVNGGNFYIGQYGYNLWLPYTSGTLALTAGTGHAGNLAALDSQGNPTDSLIPAANVALKGEIPYALVTKTITNGAVSLDDRASNSVTVSATLSPNTLTINFPTAPTGKLRDFAMRLNIAAGVTAPEIAWPQGVTLENNGGEVPEIADGGTGGSSTILYFSESENNGTTAKFTVKGETLTAIAQA